MNFRIKMTVKENLVFLAIWRLVCLKVVIYNFINRKGMSRTSALVFSLWSHIWGKQKMVLCGRKLIPYIFYSHKYIRGKNQNSQCNLTYYIFSSFCPLLFALKVIYFCLFEIDLPWMNHNLNRPGLPNWLACGQIYGHSFLRVWCYNT